MHNLNASEDWTISFEKRVLKVEVKYIEQFTRSTENFSKAIEVNLRNVRQNIFFNAKVYFTFQWILFINFVYFSLYV